MADVTDPVAAALAIIDDPARMMDKTWLIAVYMPAAKTVAAEVERLREDVAHWQRKELVRGSCCTDNEQRANQAEAALSALREQGYILAARLLQSDVVLDDTETAARDVFLEAWARREP